MVLMTVIAPIAPLIAPRGLLVQLVQLFSVKVDSIKKPAQRPVFVKHEQLKRWLC